MGAFASLGIAAFAVPVQSDVLHARASEVSLTVIIEPATWFAL